MSESHADHQNQEHQTKANDTGGGGGAGASGDFLTAASYLQRRKGTNVSKPLDTKTTLSLQRTMGNRFVNNLVNGNSTSKPTSESESNTPNLKIQRLAYDDPPPWSGVTVKRSGEGVKGVFFVSDGTDKIVLKPLNSVGNVDFANKFMEEGMGFDAPQAKNYEKTSTEGQAIKDLLMANKDKGRTENEIPDQIAGANYFMVMSLVEGNSIQTLTDDQAALFITDASAMRDVGKLFVADAFLGNDDRLVGGRVNLGNFFYAAAGTLNARVTTIDNDSKFEKASLDSKGKVKGDLANKLHRIADLLKEDYRKASIGMFINKFKTSHKNHPTAMESLDEEFVQKEVSAGMDLGFAQMANVFKTNIALIKKLNDYNDNSDHDYSAAKATTEFVKDINKGTSKKDAIDKVNTYVSYRANQDKTWTGFKWISNLINKRGFSK